MLCKKMKIFNPLFNLEAENLESSKIIYNRVLRTGLSIDFTYFIQVQHCYTTFLLSTFDQKFNILTKILTHFV